MKQRNTRKQKRREIFILIHSLSSLFIYTKFQCYIFINSYENINDNGMTIRFINNSMQTIYFQNNTSKYGILTFACEINK